VTRDGYGRWLLVRHGESVANADGWLAGHLDAPLTPRGRAQALALAATLRDESIDRAFASDMSRAIDTATIVLGNRPFTVDPRLRERFLGEWEGWSKADLQSIRAFDTLIRWDRPPPGGESQLAVAKRLLAALADLDAPDTTLIVFHGTAMRCVLGVLDEVPFDAIGERAILNAELVVREVPVGTWARLSRQLEHR
jgi:broad specificity phosphatase PhoE